MNILTFFKIFPNGKDAAVISVHCAVRSCSTYFQHTVAAINENATLYCRR